MIECICHLESGIASNAFTDTFITVASWNGTQWKDLGQGIITGSKVTGNIKSSSTALHNRNSQ
ncbi:MAG: hypothetical protein IPP71_00305 [Bacteroidetes bacterium]|nr:hypothetical protein [Bacteroidota bacterium]